MPLTAQLVTQPPKCFLDSFSQREFNGVCRAKTPSYASLSSPNASHISRDTNGAGRVSDKGILGTISQYQPPTPSPPACSPLFCAFLVM